jgi:hypothetical protein
MQQLGDSNAALLCPNRQAFRLRLPHNRRHRARAKDKSMKASDVRILPALEAGESYVDSNFLLVETVFDDDGDTVTTIDHVSNKSVGGKDRWDVTTLGQCVPMSHAAAREWAVSFAASRGIPLVYERDDTRSGSYAATPSVEAAPASSASK